MTQQQTASRPFGAREVLRQRSSGELYVVRDGQLGRIIDQHGQRHYVLEPAFNLVDDQGQPRPELESVEWQYELLMAHLASSLSVSQRELDSDFETVPRLFARQNSDIESLLRAYAAEGNDFSDAQWLVRCAKRLSLTMPDSQARCLLHALALRCEEHERLRQI